DRRGRRAAEGAGSTPRSGPARTRSSAEAPAPGDAPAADGPDPLRGGTGRLRAAGRSATDGAAGLTSSSGSATSRQQLLPIGPGRAVRSPHAPASVTAGVRRPALVLARQTAAQRHEPPHPSPLALCYAHNRESRSRRTAGHVN